MRFFLTPQCGRLSRFLSKLIRKPNRENELNISRHTVVENVVFCIASTAQCIPPLLLWCGIAVVLNVAVPLLSMYLPKSVIDVISDGGDIVALIFTVLSFSLGIALLSGARRFIERFIASHKYEMNTYYTQKVADKGMTTDYHNQENDRFRKLQSESFSSCNGHSSPATQVYDAVIALLSGVLGLFAYFSILAQQNILLVLLIIVTTSSKFFLNNRVIQWASDHNREKIGYGQKTGYLNTASADIKSAKDIRLYAMREWFDKIYADTLKGLSGWYRRYTQRIARVAFIDGGLSLLREGVAYAYLIYLALDKQISVADFVLYFTAITGFSKFLGDVLGQINALNHISLSINHLRAFFEYPEDFRRSGGREVDGLMAMPKTIELKDVSYRYENAEGYALKHVSLTLKPSEHLAIVGLNGAGKTTLMKLICGLCDPTEGAVYYDGVDVRDYNRISYYKLFSAVFQQFSLLPVTIEEIVAEEAAAHLNAEQVEDCLRSAGLWEKVCALPNGVKSNYGKTVYDDGVEFSGGETQKLLLARALYKRAPVMILDEPTAALDPISESRLYEAYDALMGEKSAIFISHRLASTRFCHRILLIENGSICEEGTHESLLAQRDRYYDLFEKQAKYYRENPEGEAVIDHE